MRRNLFDASTRGRAKVPAFPSNSLNFQTQCTSRTFMWCRRREDVCAVLRRRRVGKDACERVIFTIPSMDIAILEEWPEDGECLNVQPLLLEEERVKCDSQSIYCVGFPEGLTLQRSHGYLSGRSPDLEDHLVFNLSINHGNSGGPIFSTKEPIRSLRWPRRLCREWRELLWGYRSGIYSGT